MQGVSHLGKSFNSDCLQLVLSGRRIAVCDELFHVSGRDHTMVVWQLEPS
jgi:hypothetical protein